MKITFFGAAREVTGSCYHVQLSRGTEIIIDAGYFQGHEEDLVRNGQKLPVDWKNIKYLLLTHGHLDHCGRLPVFYKFGFRGKIIATAPTRDISEIVWRDNLGLLKHATNLANTDPFFTEDDIIGCLNLFETIDYEKNINIDRNASAVFVDAGHILGSASIKITDGAESVVFSGDLGNWPMGVVRPTVHPGAADAVIMETTYGKRTHEDKERQKYILKNSIDHIIQNHSTLLIPAFAIERSQELLFDLDALVEESVVPEIPVFLDSPMAIRVTDVFKKYKKFLSDDAQKQYAEGDDPFSFPRFMQTRSTEESKAINNTPGPKIIIAGSGMMTGGRVMHHLKKVLPDPRSVLLIVGFQVPGTLGRKIRDGEKVNIMSREYKSKCSVQTVEAYSAHADKNQLLDWLKKFNPAPQKLILTHGDVEPMDEFAQTVKNDLDIIAHKPKFAETLEI